MPDSSKTEKATPKKRQDERKKGNIFHSRDAVSAVSILAVFLSLRFAFPHLYRTLARQLADHIRSAGTADALTPALAAELFRGGAFTVLSLCAPVMLAAMFSGILITGAQTRFRFAGEKIKPKLSNMNPVKGVGRMFSLRSAAELLKTLLKITAIGAVLARKLLGLGKEIPKLMTGQIVTGASFILNAVMDAVMSVSLVFIGLAALDYLYQWWEYEREMKMTKQEVRDEYRQQEGDPQIKSQIRQQQKKLAMRRMMQKVPDADVVIRNPTHYAVALAYDADKNGAPVVVAKGQDDIALKIVETAERHGVPVTENKPLARALYETAALDKEIPEEFYVALADVLVWVYSLRKEKK